MLKLCVGNIDWLERKLCTVGFPSVSRVVLWSLLSIQHRGETHRHTVHLHLHLHLPPNGYTKYPEQDRSLNRIKFGFGVRMQIIGESNQCLLSYYNVGIDSIVLYLLDTIRGQTTTQPPGGTQPNTARLKCIDLFSNLNVLISDRQVIIVGVSLP